MPNLIVIGAGIVGLSCALSAMRRGWQVSLIDKNFEGDRASHGNAAGIAVTECIPLSLAGLGMQPLQWLLDPLGPLAIRVAHAPRLLPWFMALRKVSQPDHYQRIAMALAAINDRCMADFEMLLAETGMSATLHKAGALTVYESERAFIRDKGEWDLKRSLGVDWCLLDRTEISQLEPDLSPIFETGVMLKKWAHIDDPEQLVAAVRRKLQDSGATLISGSASCISIWESDGPAVILSDGCRLSGDKVVVAAGAWSASLAASVGDKVLLESERGYNTTLPFSAGRLNREVIFAERKFVATPLSIGLRIGGAAEFAGLDAPPNYQRSAALLQLARRFIPNLDERDARQWMGNRPATPDSLPVIGLSKISPDVLYAFGHGHLGLTQAATTGELIGNLLNNQPSNINIEPYSIARF